MFISYQLNETSTMKYTKGTIVYFTVLLGLVATLTTFQAASAQTSTTSNSQSTTQRTSCTSVNGVQQCQTTICTTTNGVTNCQTTTGSSGSSSVSTRCINGVCTTCINGVCSPPSTTTTSASTSP